MYIETTENENQDDKFFLGILGEAGIEYRFRNAPIVIGIDWRPSFKLIDKTKFSVGGFGLNIRFVF
jgi:hypothetical protein